MHTTNLGTAIHQFFQLLPGQILQARCDPDVGFQFGQ